jgi:hypothetical protein
MHLGASQECIHACTQIVRLISRGQRLGVDSSDLILREYVDTLKTNPGAGAAAKLAKTLWSTRFNDAVCHRIEILATADGSSFDEIPDGLRNFDSDDQKFLATALAEGSGPPVFQALDTEWWTRRNDLRAGGLDIQFLCSTDLL